MTTYPAHIEVKANEMLAKGAKMTFEAICEMFMKSEAKAAKKSGSKQEAAKWEHRANIENAPTPTKTHAEMMRENAIKNLPSSMR